MVVLSGLKRRLSTCTDEAITRIAGTKNTARGRRDGARSRARQLADSITKFRGGDIPQLSLVLIWCEQQQAAC